MGSKRKTALFVGVLLVAACTGSSGDTTVTTAAGSSSTTGEQETTTTVPATTTTTEPLEHGTLESPVPPGRFVYEFNGAVWEGEIHGLVEVEAEFDPPEDLGIPEGRCALISGTATLRELPDDILFPDFDHIPAVVLVSRGEPLPLGVHCSNPFGQGYWPMGSAIAVGTTFSFAVPVVITDDTQAIMVGPDESARGGPPFFFSPTVIPKLPAPVFEEGDMIAGLTGLLPMDGEPFLFEDFAGNVWEVRLFGMTELPPGSTGGRCLALFGTVRPVETDNPEMLGWSVGLAGLVVDGFRHTDDFGILCHDPSLEDAGYQAAPESAEVGEEVAVYWLFDIDAEQGADLQLVHLMGEDQVLIEPKLLNGIPSP